MIHPEGTGTPKSWNAGGCCSPASTEGVDDMGFMSALVDEAAKRLCVDPSRVYLMGLSNGGYIAYQQRMQARRQVRRGRVGGRHPPPESVQSVAPGPAVP